MAKMRVETDRKTELHRIADRMLGAAIRKEEAGDLDGCEKWLAKALEKEAEAAAF